MKFLINGLCVVFLFMAYHSFAKDADKLVEFIHQDFYTAVNDSELSTFFSSYPLQTSLEPSLANTLKALNDPHTYIEIKSSGQRVYSAPKICKRTEIASFAEAKEQYNYIQLKSFSGSDKEAATYVNHYRKRLASFPEEKPLIVDLRGNNGGKLWLMLGAIAPIFRENSNILMFSYRQYSKPIFVTKEGILFGNKVHPNGDYPISKFKKVSTLYVIIDGSVASSAEGVAISLMSQNAILVGKPTCGLATVVRPYETETLRLMLTVAQFTSTDNKVFPKGITPHYSFQEFVGKK